MKEEKISFLNSSLVTLMACACWVSLLLTSLATGNMGPMYLFVMGFVWLPLLLLGLDELQQQARKERIRKSRLAEQLKVMLKESDSLI